MIAINRILKAPMALILILLAMVARGGDIPNDTCTNGDIFPTTPSSEFTEVGDGSIVLHNRTGLEWRRCPEGRVWDGIACDSISHLVMTWQEALEHADDIDSWRLPNIKELASIVEICRSDPAINRQVFPNTNPTVRFWSASVRSDNEWLAWSVDFDFGSDNTVFKSDELLVRLVRVAQ